MTVYQGVDLGDFPPCPIPRPPVLGIVARLDPVKGHRYLLEAASILRKAGTEVTLRIAGREYNTKEAEIRAQAARLDLSSSVQILGYQERIPALMAGCAVGVISSVGSEAISRVALEWMAAGRPVVATAVGCLPELIRPGETGLLVPPRDAEALAASLRELLHHPERLESMGRAARAEAEERFALPRFVQENERVYREALEEARCRA